MKYTNVHKLADIMWIWISNKFAKFHAKIPNRSENIPKSFRGYLFFWNTLYIVYILFSNIKYSMTHQHKLGRKSTSSSTICIILPMTKHDVIIEYFINGIFNNSLKYYVLVW